MTAHGRLCSWSVENLDPYALTSSYGLVSILPLFKCIDLEEWEVGMGPTTSLTTEISVPFVDFGKYVTLG